MSGEDVANAMMALQMGTYASEKAVDPKLAAAMASTRRQNEMIVPGPQPPPPEHMADVYHRQQAVAALNVAGPGEKYQTRDPSHCAVRYENMLEPVVRGSFLYIENAVILLGPFVLLISLYKMIYS
jgi:hypothetical protein